MDQAPELKGTNSNLVMQVAQLGDEVRRLRTIVDERDEQLTQLRARLDAVASHARSEKLRILVGSAPKTGNVWMKHILAVVFGLEVLEAVPSDQPHDLRQFIRDGKFRHKSIFHQHYWPNADFFESLSAIDCHLVSTIRNPYDVFVSLYHYVQHGWAGLDTNHDPAGKLVGKEIDHPDVLDFLAEDFAGHLQLALSWMQSGRTIVTRYEALYADPISEVMRITDRINPVPMGYIVEGVQASRADALRARNPEYQRHIRTATVGDWKNHLTEAHLSVFREKHGHLIEALGYNLI